MPPTVLPELTRSSSAPPPRTLVDVFSRTVALHPDAMAVDAGTATLSYAELAEAAQEVADRLGERGIGPGDRVGVRIRSGTTDLYVAILGVLLAGAAYVPVDADDPDERARVVFEESGAAAVLGDDLEIADRAPAHGGGGELTPSDDAWVIFTSGSTGVPKGVAVTHRNAAAFVDAEAQMFLQDDPIGPQDRVMAGLSVAFDASCEEIWLAWAHGACLVPAPRSLVRSGVDVGPWLVGNRISIVSTVPTLVALWPPASLERVRLLILGGEAFPPELVERLQAPGREVWNTYGPTEATVVACGAQVTGEGPVRIGLPLAGWDLAVVDAAGQPVEVGATGELIIGGVGLARYLDPAKDAERYAPMPTLGWQRAYRSGDLVVNDPAGLLFAGRADEQVKIGGRRIELGEVDDQLLRLPGVRSAAAAVRTTASGNRLLVGYVQVGEGYDPDAAVALLRERLPAALVPRVAEVDEVPVKTSGKVDRDALPWPLPSRTGPPSGLDATQTWLAEIWADVLGADATTPAADFFTLGGGSLTAAQVVGRVRERHPEVVVADVYEHPTPGALAAMLDGLQRRDGEPGSDRRVTPIRRRTQVAQLLALPALRALTVARWLAWVVLGASVLSPLVPWLDPSPVWALVLAALAVTPPARMLLAAGLVRLVTRTVTPGTHPRGGRVHLRLWLAERLQEELAAVTTAGAPFIRLYARALGCEVGPGVDLHSLPPVTGLLTIGEGAAVEPEVDLSGTWIDGDLLRVGAVRVGPGARVGTRSTLGPGARLRRGAEIAPGSYVDGEVPRDEAWSGSPATRHGAARGAWTTQTPPRAPAWLVGYAVLSLLIGALPGLGALAGLAVVLRPLREAPTWEAGVRAALPWLPLAALVGYVVLGLLVLALVRALALLVRPGHHPVRSARGLALWGTVRVLDEARTWLFPLYSGALTPLWLRLLGTQVGRGVEASTVLLVPSLTQVNDHAFLADDTLIGGYELAAGWIRAEHVKIGKRAFIGNSGMAAPGRRVRKQSLVAVLSAAPGQAGRAKAGQSWLGSPPTPLRRTANGPDDSRTYSPSRRLRLLRALVETTRLVPLVAHVALLAATTTALWWLLTVTGAWALLLGIPVLVAAGIVAAALAVAAKWLLVGRHRPGEHPLWSGFVWRNELADTFVEMLAAPWFAGPSTGTLVLTWWLRAMGVRVGRGVWCDTYWLPESDLVRLADGASVNVGCVVQTHLFHDRVLSLDTVTLEAGATLGPHSVILPAARIGRHATVGPVSLVMRGEDVPSRTRWIGNPIGPWEEHE